MTSIQEQAIAVAASFQGPLAVDAGGSLTSSGAIVPLPQLMAAHLVAHLGNELAAAQSAFERAKRFMHELLESTETLTSIAEEHGPRTLADLFYLHSAIAEGSFIDYYPNSDESSVKDIAAGLPSGAEWLTYIKVEYLTGSGDALPDPNAFPDIVVGQQYEFYAEMQESEKPAEERMRNYTGQMVTVISAEPQEDEEASPLFVVQASDGRQFTAAEEELNGWDKALGQFFWPDGTYGPNRDRTYLANDEIAAAKR